MRSFAGVYVHIKHLKLKLLKLSRMQTATIYNYTQPSSFRCITCSIPWIRHREATALYSRKTPRAAREPNRDKNAPCGANH